MWTSPISNYTRNCTSSRLGSRALRDPDMTLKDPFGSHLSVGNFNCPALWLQLFPEQCTQTATISIRINAQSCVLCWQSISEECLHYERLKLWFITGPQDCICTVRLNIQVVSEAEDRETNIGPTVLFVLKTTDTHGGWWSQPSLKLSAGNQVEITPGWIPWVGMFR